MKLKKKGIAILWILIFTMIVCGFKKKSITLDTESRILYQNCSVAKIVSDIERDREEAKKLYDDCYYVILGKITEIAKNNKAVVISDVSDVAQKTIKCSASDKVVTETIKNLKVGDIVKVYGKTKMDIWNKHISVDASQITKAETVDISETVYSFIDEKMFDISKMDIRDLDDGKVKYYVPSNWTQIEKGIVKSDLGSMEGYQYTLNEMPGDLAVEPESFFVCYFDSKVKLKDRSQVGETKEIRKAIVGNILKSDGEKIKNNDLKKVKSHYGVEYYYYDGTYEDKEGKGHYVEFVFQDVGYDGMVVYLYVYKQENHIDDILGVMRCLTVS